MGNLKANTNRKEAPLVHTRRDFGTALQRIAQHNLTGGFDYIAVAGREAKPVVFFINGRTDILPEM